VDLQLRHGVATAARAHYEKSLASFRAYPDFAIVCLSKLGDPENGMHDGWTTFEYAGVLLGYAKKAQNRVATHHALRCMGDFFFGRGDDDTALNLFTTALDGFTAMDVHRSKGQCLVRIAEIYERRGQREQWAELLQEARGMFEKSSQKNQAAILEVRLERGEHAFTDGVQGP
jgi:hypothetical protein